MSYTILTQAEIAVLRACDTAAASWVLGWPLDPPAVRATPAECAELAPSLAARGYMSVDGGRYRTNARGRWQYRYWLGGAR